MATTNYDNIEKDSRVTGLKEEETAALKNNDVQSNKMISEAESYYKDAVEKIGVQDEKGNWSEGSWADTQTDLVNQQTDFAIAEIEQNKEQAKKDYIKEQKGAYVDWQKQSDPYGAKAEQVAAQGLAGSGYSESSRVSMYNTYQNRIAAARESYNRVVQNYNNAITEAKLQNSSLLAEIATKAMEKGLELTIQGMQYKNQLINEQVDRKLAIQTLYQTKWRDVYDQINTEIAYNESVRQHNEDMEYKNATLAEEKRQFDILHPVSTGGSSPKIVKSITNPSNPNSSKSNGARINEQAANKSASIAAEDYINELINSGATKDTVLREISLARSKGVITAAEAKALQEQWAPRGLQY